MLQQQSSPMAQILYRECLKNHATRIGSNVTDGCGEFMPSGHDGTLEALRCAACSCHRNFHRKEQLAEKKRHRTKFTVEQKEKMLEFAEKVGWRIPQENDTEMQRFCGEVGVKRQVFKAWMHNNRKLRRQETSAEAAGSNVTDPIFQ